MKLGRIEKVDLRSQWQTEDRDFTPWLAKEENIQLLSTEIGIDLEVENTEVSIGSFKADIVAVDPDGRKVIIENQLTKTDHKHLGQLITYASGLDARTIIWICTEVTDEHRQAIDWLNSVTAENLLFFACVIELWKIGDSDPAPRFNIISSPNDWSKSVKGVRSLDSLSPTKQSHLDFWNSFKEYATEADTFLSLRTPRPQHWYLLAVGRSKFSLSLTRNTQTRKIGCELYIRGKQAKKAFAELMKHADQIEGQLGQLDWQELPEGQDCRIIKYKTTNSVKAEQWPEIHKWMKENAEQFFSTLSRIVKNLKL